MLMEKQTNLTRETQQRKRPAEPLPAPPSDSLSTVLALIERTTLDPTAGVEKLDRLAVMYERLKAKEAELAFNGAKGRILKKLAGIKIVKNRPVLPESDNGKPQKGTFEAFKYAPLEEIDKHLRPLLTEEQMDLSYSDEPCEGGGILVRGRLKHLPGGHYEDSFMPAPLDTTGGKSNVQAVGSTNSFLRRYVACNIFNIVVVGDDDDGIGGTLDKAQAKLPIPVDVVKSIRQIYDRSAAPRGVTRMQLGDRGELSAQIRDYDARFTELLNPSGNGQKFMQAILLREAFCRFAQQGIAIKQDAPTLILDVSCGPGDYSVAWTSQIARFLPKGIAFYCTDYPDGISRETGETYAMSTAKKMQAAAENGRIRLAQAPVSTDADLFSGHDALMPCGKTADIVHWSQSGYHVRDALGAARNDPRAIEAGLHAARR
jgi:hypothetical protein